MVNDNSIAKAIITDVGSSIILIISYTPLISSRKMSYRITPAMVLAITIPL